MGASSVTKLGYTIRRALPGDLSALQMALACAIDWREQEVAETPEARVAETGHSFLLADWGREGDAAVVAETAAGPIGAAWYRYWTDEAHSYGYLDASTPELGVGVLPQYRGQGIGSALLGALLDVAEGQGIRAISLSVERDNPAQLLYERLGFEPEAGSGTAWTMLKRF